MFTNLFRELGLQGWEDVIVVPAIGVGIGLAAFVVLRALANRRGKGPLLPPLPAHSASETAFDPYQGGTFGEKRIALRRPGNPIPVMISDATVTTEPFYGWVLDRSMGGLCLSVEKAIAVGSVISVRATNAPETAPWVQVEVKRCREDGNTHEVGCQFLKTPAWGVLLLFG